MSDHHKNRIIGCWLCMERMGWVIVVLLHLGCNLFIFQFVRFYEWNLIQKWVLAIVQGVFHRFFSAPGIRMVWLFVLLLSARFSGVCNGYFAQSPHISTFPDGLEPVNSDIEHHDPDSHHSLLHSLDDHTHEAHNHISFF
jgi:hypothetical protein